jgi:hypothetical protein
MLAGFSMVSLILILGSRAGSVLQVIAIHGSSTFSERLAYQHPADALSHVDMGVEIAFGDVDQ